MTPPERPTDAAIAALLDDLLIDPQESETPEQVGGWLLAEKLGEGGFGIVWRATQQNPAPREAAVKLIKPGIDSEEVLARFQREQQVLARLADDPGIARVFEAGLTADERPYLVMELVRGVTVTEFCAQHQLTLPERIALLRQICASLHHAHQNGVIHRDLKPSNLLVATDGGRPQVKIIDFGIARALSHEGQRQLTWITRQQRLVGTPGWMAPEQTRLDGITDVRTDIHALGILLYEFIAGRAPFAATLSIQEKLRQIREYTPQPPSQATTHRHAAELDWITLRCLEKDPARRYASVQALDDDLRRWQEGLPVTAHPPTTAYLLGRWLHRHRGLAAALLLILLATLTGIAAALWQRQQAERQLKASLRLQELLLSGLDHSLSTIAGMRPHGYAAVRPLLGPLLNDEIEVPPAMRLKLLEAAAAAAENAGDMENARRARQQAAQLRGKEADS